MRNVYANTRRTPVGTDGATYAEYVSINEHERATAPGERYAIVVRNVCGNLHSFALSLDELEALGEAVSSAVAFVRNAEFAARADAATLQTGFCPGGASVMQQGD